MRCQFLHLLLLILLEKTAFFLFTVKVQDSFYLAWWSVIQKNSWNELVGWVFGIYFLSKSHIAWGQVVWNYKSHVSGDDIGRWSNLIVSVSLIGFDIVNRDLVSSCFQVWLMLDLCIIGHGLLLHFNCIKVYCMYISRFFASEIYYKQWKALYVWVWIFLKINSISNNLSIFF